MYLGKREIMRLDEYNERRKELITNKSGAVWNAFVELEGLINKTQLAEQYFNRTQAWLSQRLNGCTMRNKKMNFNAADYAQMAEAFRHIAKRLEAHAAEIDAAEMDEPQDN